MGVDGAWGTGKTWTANKWIAKINNSQSEDRDDESKESSAEPAKKYHQISAHEWELVEDPITIIIGALSEFAVETQAKSIIEKGTNVVRGLNPRDFLNLAPALVAAATTASGLGAIGAATSDLIKEFSNREREYWEEQINAYRQHQANIKELRHEVSKIERLGGDQRRLLIVDELDRCRPDFAVRFLERLRLVLGDDSSSIMVAVFADRSALSQSIYQQYGWSGGSELYLTKFVNYWHQLETSDIEISLRRYQNFWKAHLEYNLRPELMSELAQLSLCFELTIRQIEQVSALIASHSEMRNENIVLATFASVCWLEKKLTTAELANGFPRNKPVWQKFIERSQSLETLTKVTLNTLLPLMQWGGDKMNTDVYVFLRLLKVLESNDPLV